MDDNSASVYVSGCADAVVVAVLLDAEAVPACCGLRGLVLLTLLLRRCFEARERLLYWRLLLSAERGVARGVCACPAGAEPRRVAAMPVLPPLWLFSPEAVAADAELRFALMQAKSERA